MPAPALSQALVSDATKVSRAVEFVVLFAGPPLLLYFRVLPNWPIPILLLVAAAVYLWLHRDSEFDRRELFRWPSLRQVFKIGLRNVGIGVLLCGGLLVWRPDLLFSFPQRSPVLWAFVMVLYPLLSAYPQELIYRAFLFHRYKALFGSTFKTALASAFVFGFVHIVFGNWLSVVLSLAGGVILCRTYLRTGSLVLAAIDHAMLGDIVFTVGLGQFFFHGARG